MPRPLLRGEWVPVLLSRLRLPCPCRHRRLDPMIWVDRPSGLYLCASSRLPFPKCVRQVLCLGRQGPRISQADRLEPDTMQTRPSPADCDYCLLSLPLPLFLPSKYIFIHVHPAASLPIALTRSSHIVRGGVRPSKDPALWNQLPCCAVWPHSKCCVVHNVRLDFH
ncbi:hypothetical protein BN1708_014426, partial [Verticillium longisporum]